MTDALLDVLDGLTSAALVPNSVEFFRDGTELNDEVVGEILSIDLAALFAPKTDEVFFIITHDDARIRAADEIAAIVGIEFKDWTPSFSAI